MEEVKTTRKARSIGVSTSGRVTMMAFSKQLKL